MSPSGKAKNGIAACVYRPSLQSVQRLLAPVKELPELRFIMRPVAARLHRRLQRRAVYPGKRREQLPPVLIKAAVPLKDDVLQDKERLLPGVRQQLRTGLVPCVDIRVAEHMVEIPDGQLRKRPHVLRRI